MERRGWLAVAVLLVGGGFIYAGMKAAGGRKAPAFTETAPYFAPPAGAPVVGPDQHIGGVTFTPHRYPASVAGEITAVMHRGWAQAAIPNERQMLWLTNPPAEATL
ncbi:MAG: hypothetical protein M0030_04490 [Actinomycetota bacterium]|nr:hypothetical protein [Actinomycetota bacterium]